MVAGGVVGSRTHIRDSLGLHERLLGSEKDAWVEGQGETEPPPGNGYLSARLVGVTALLPGCIVPTNHETQPTTCYLPASPLSCQFLDARNGLFPACFFHPAWGWYTLDIQLVLIVNGTTSVFSSSTLRSITLICLKFTISSKLSIFTVCSSHTGGCSWCWYVINQMFVTHHLL